MSGDTRLTAEQAAVAADWYAFAVNYVRKISIKGAAFYGGDDFEDLVLEASVNGLIGACRSFDPKNGCPWPVYLTRRLRGARKDWLRDRVYEARRVHKLSFTLMAFEDVDYIGHGYSRSAWEVDTDPKVSFTLLRLRRRLDEALQPFSEKNQAIIRQLFQDRTQAEVAEDFGVTDSRVCQIWRQFEKSIAC